MHSFYLLLSVNQHFVLMRLRQVETCYRTRVVAEPFDSGSHLCCRQITRTSYSLNFLASLVGSFDGEDFSIDTLLEDFVFHLFQGVTKLRSKVTKQDMQISVLGGGTLTMLSLHFNDSTLFVLLITILFVFVTLKFVFKIESTEPIGTPCASTLGEKGC